MAADSKSSSSLRSLPQYVEFSVLQNLKNNLNCLFICFSEYHRAKLSSNFKVKYFVRSDFDETYSKGSSALRELEREVESDYVTYLRTSCYQERVDSKFYFKGFNRIFAFGEVLDQCSATDSATVRRVRLVVKTPYPNTALCYA